MRYRIAQEDYTSATTPLVPVAPTDGSLSKIIALAKAADVVVYAGHWGGPLYLEIPSTEEDAGAMFEMASNMGLQLLEPVGI